MSLVASPFTDRRALAAWESDNCARCARDRDEVDGYRCPIQLALRCAVPGPIATEVAARMGYVGPAGIRLQDGLWPCREARLGGYFVHPIGYHHREEIVT